MVDYSSLENYRTERYRGFESLSLRKEFSTSLSSFFLFLCLNQFHSLRSAFASIAFSMLSGRVGKKSMSVILST